MTSKPDLIAALEREVEQILRSDALAPWRNLSGEVASEALAKVANMLTVIAALRATEGNSDA